MTDDALVASIGGSSASTRRRSGGSNPASRSAPATILDGDVLQHQLDQQLPQQPGARCGDHVLVPSEHDRQQAQDTEELGGQGAHPAGVGR